MTLQEWTRRTCHAAGIPLKVTDAATVAGIAALLRGTQKLSCNAIAPSRRPAGSAHKETGDDDADTS
jgi:hypothetical protein